VVAAVSLVSGYGVLLMKTWRSPPEPNDWLVIPKVECGRQPHGNAAQPAICLLASNAGPRNLEFRIAWFECRADHDFKLLIAPQSAGETRKRFPVTPHSITDVFIPMPTNEPPRESYLFCCQITWAGEPSRIYRAGHLLDRPMYLVTSFMGLSWNPPWRHKRDPGGEVFVSNLRVEDYFSQVYGFAREGWDERQQREWSEFVRASVPPGTQIIWIHRDVRYTPEELVREQAKSVFSEFCRNFAKQR